MLVCCMLLTLCACGRTATQEELPGSTEERSASLTGPEDSASAFSAAEPETSDEETEAEVLLRSMTLEEKIWQLFIVTPEQLLGTEEAVTEVPGGLEEALREKPVGGVIFFAQNIVSPMQTRALLDGLQSASRLGLFLSVDEEGGTVARVGKNAAMGTTRFGDMAEIGASGDPERARDVGRTIAAELGTLGFNLDFAPVADVFSNPANPIIGKRSFGSDPELVADFVTAAVEGFHEGGMLCTLKHFPGHGDTGEDSHTALAVTQKTLEELKECEFLPFAAGIAGGADLVMVGHIAAPNALGDSTPASLSEGAVTGLLREELGFDGVAVTDALNMGAVTALYAPGEAAVLAVQAGEDVLLDPEDLGASYQGILDAVEDGRLTEKRIDESVLRILRLKLQYGIIPGET